MLRCPECQNNGENVKRVTLESLLRPECRADIGDGRYRVCTTPGCATVYFGAGDDRTFRKCDLVVRFGLKETGPPRPVCYCFDHTIEDIHDEIRRTGQSTVLDRIKAGITESGCRCEHTNPLGVCCLKSVQTVVSQGFRLVGRQEEMVGRGEVDHQNCCAAPTDSRVGTARRDRSGVFAAGGSVLAAMLSSACCWLPLLLIAFGASAAGVAGFFQRRRPYFVACAVVLLGAAFYRVYFRTGRCEPDSICAASRRKLKAFNRVMLWAATALVAAFVFFPNYFGFAVGGFTVSSSATESVAEASLVTAEFRIEGMTCEACARRLRSALARLPEVKQVDVDYENRTAMVRFDADKPLLPGHVIEVAKAAGFEASPLRVTP